MDKIEYLLKRSRRDVNFSRQRWVKEERQVQCRAARSLCSEATVRLGRHRAGGNGLLGVV
jgi:hypothetical protein